MAEKSYTVTIKSDSEQRCTEVMQALMDLKKVIPDDKLIKLAKKAKESPGKLQTYLSMIG